MDTQDNEFDGSFRDKLNGFESEPSEKVWTGIDSVLDKNKIALLPWLSIAASIIVLVSAGILFIPKHREGGHVGNGTARVKPAAAAKDQQAVKPVEQVAVTMPTVQKDEPVKQEHGINTKKRKEPSIVAPVLVKPDETIARNVPVQPAQQPEVMASVVPQKTDDAKQGVVPVPETQLVVKHNIDSAINIAKPTQVAKIQPEMKTGTPAVKKHGIRNFGELVNLVVAKVDKRKDKAIEFTDDDDSDGSTLTAVNIGPVKIRKEEK
jgi:cytoskeletal protein RodZ